MELTTFKWGIALGFLEAGKNVARLEWTKRDSPQYLFLIEGPHFKKIVATHIGMNAKKIPDQIWIVTSKEQWVLMVGVTVIQWLMTGYWYHNIFYIRGFYVDSTN